MQLTFLGTACMVPTKERNVQGIFLAYKSNGILIDCGEGTQRQMNQAGINRNRVNTILVTHWHGDHVGGIIGLLQTISDKEDPPSIEIYGPAGTKKRVQHLLDSVVFESSHINLDVKEIKPKGIEVIKDTDDYEIVAAKMDHTTPCVAYSFVEKDTRKVKMAKAKRLGLKEGPQIGKLQRGETVKVKGKTINPDDVSYMKKGRKLTFIFDTRPNKNSFDIASESNILVTEAVYLPELQDKADKYKHMTTEDAGLIANKSNSKKLIATHFSQRYKDISVLEKDLKTYFVNSKCAYDFMKVKL